MAAAVIVAGANAYLGRYEVVEGSSAISYRVHDRWTRQMTTCTHLVSHKATVAAEVDCSTWGPLIGGQP